MSLLLIVKIVCFSSLSISSGHLFSWKAELETLLCIVSLHPHQDLRTFWNGMHFCKSVWAPREVLRRQVHSAPDSCRCSHFPWRRWEIWKPNCLQADILGKQPALWPLLGEQCVQLRPERKIRSQLFFTITRIQIHYDLLSFVSSSLNFCAWHPGHPPPPQCSLVYHVSYVSRRTSDQVRPLLWFFSFESKVLVGAIFLPSSLSLHIH